jgi:hypothetical protein
LPYQIKVLTKIIQATHKKKKKKKKTSSFATPDGDHFSFLEKQDKMMCEKAFALKVIFIVLFYCAL